MAIGHTVSEAVIGLRRNLVMSTAAVITIAVTLTFFGAAMLVRGSVDRLEEAFLAQIEVIVYLDGDVTPAERSDINVELQALPLVERVTYNSKQQAYERLLRQNPNDPEFTDNVTPDILPEYYTVKLSDPERFDIVSSAAQDLPGVDEVEDNRGVLDNLFEVLDGLRLLVFVTAAVQAIAATLLIANTVRLTAFSRRREIGVMRLVGATRWHIQLPFLIEGLIVGVLGTALAGGMLALTKVLLLDDELSGVFTLTRAPNWEDIFWTEGRWVLLLGLAVSVGASLVSTHRYVRT